MLAVLRGKILVTSKLTEIELRCLFNLFKLTIIFSIWLVSLVLDNRLLAISFNTYSTQTDLSSITLI